jgi:hypothetical protein
MVVLKFVLADVFVGNKSELPVLSTPRELSSYADLLFCYKGVGWPIFGRGECIRCYETYIERCAFGNGSDEERDLRCDIF